jgi:hypothetical protein
VTSPELPPCGLYRTLLPILDLPAGRLVYFHNHGNPGPGVYFPEKWTANRAHFSPKGMTLPTPFDPGWLQPLPREGFYRVTKAFHCCAKKCTEFQPDAFVQLGYNGTGRALLFVPELAGGAISIPGRGVLIDDEAFANLVALQVNERKTEDRDDLSLPRGIIVH